MRLSFSGERKYLWSGCSSKISNKEHPLAVLGYSELLAIKYLPLTLVASVGANFKYRLPTFSLVVAKYMLDVFE